MKKLLALFAAVLVAGTAGSAVAQSAAGARSDGLLFAQAPSGEATKKKAPKGKATQTKKSETKKKATPKKKGSGKKKAPSKN